MTGPDIGAFIRARLLNKAKAEGQDFNLVLTRYALERLLYRLGSSSHAERFLLKGALLFDLWFDIPHRPTRDVDLLGFGPAEIPILEAVFRDLCAAASEPDDGIRFQAETIRAWRSARRPTMPASASPWSGSWRCALLGAGRCRLRRRGDAGTGAGRLPGHAARAAGPQTPRLPALHRGRREAGCSGHAGHRQQPHEGRLRLATCGSSPARRTSTGTFSPRRSTRPSTGAQPRCPMGYPSVSPRTSPKTARSRPSGGPSLPRMPSPRCCWLMSWTCCEAS